MQDPLGMPPFRDYVVKVAGASHEDVVEALNGLSLAYHIKEPPRKGRNTFRSSRIYIAGHGHYRRPNDCWLYRRDFNDFIPASELFSYYDKLSSPAAELHEGLLPPSHCIHESRSLKAWYELSPEFDFDNLNCRVDFRSGRRIAEITSIVMKEKDSLRKCIENMHRLESRNP